MAALNPWSLAVWALLPALAIPVIMALRGTVAMRIVALQLGGAVTSLLLLAMSFAFDQDSYTAMAVAFALLNVTGVLVMAVAVERWL